jgi:hypothetical protein
MWYGPFMRGMLVGQLGSQEERPRDILVWSRFDHHLQMTRGSVIWTQNIGAYLYLQIPTIDSIVGRPKLGFIERTTF